MRGFLILLFAGRGDAVFDVIPGDFESPGSAQGKEFVTGLMGLAGFGRKKFFKKS